MICHSSLTFRACLNPFNRHRQRLDVKRYSFTSPRRYHDRSSNHASFHQDLLHRYLKSICLRHRACYTVATEACISISRQDPQAHNKKQSTHQSRSMTRQPKHLPQTSGVSSQARMAETELPATIHMSTALPPNISCAAFQHHLSSSTLVWKPSVCPQSSTAPRYPTCTPTP